MNDAVSFNIYDVRLLLESLSDGKRWILFSVIFYRQHSSKADVLLELK